MTRPTSRTPGSWLSRAVSVTPKVMRLLAFLACIYGVGVLWAANEVEAEVEELMRGLGAEMAQFPGTAEGGLRQVYLNGASVTLTSQTIAEPMERVLDHYEGRCMARDGRLAEQIAELQAEPAVGAGDGDPRDWDGTARHVMGDSGFVACLDMGEERVGPEGLLDRVTAFLDSGDLSDVGHLRYFFVERDGSGEEERSHVVAIWSDTHLNVLSMFPEEGDAPGRDVEGIPRPPGSRRLLSAWEDGEPYSMTLYAVAGGDADALEAHYRQVLPERGWTVLGEGRDQPRHMVTVEKDERIVTVVIDDDDPSAPTVSMLTSD